MSVTNRPVAKRGGVSFIVQSPNTSAADLEQATLSFIDDFVDAWPEISEQEFEQQKSGLLNRLLQTPKNLNEQSQRYWTDLSDELYTFDSREQVADIVKTLTREDIESFLKRLQTKLQSQRLLIYTRGQFDKVPQHGELLSYVPNPSQ